MLEYLKKFGLSDKEAGVYLGLLELGPSPVSEIAAKAKINRTTAYDILESLITLGLVNHVKEKKKHYAAENPEALVTYLQNKSKDFYVKSLEAKKILPELKGAYNSIPQKPKVSYYEGEDGIIAMYEDSLTAQTEILSWLNTEQTADFGAEYFDQYYKRRTKKGIKIKAIVNDVPTSHEIHSRDKEELREMKIVEKEKMDISPECYIYDDKVSFMSLKEKFGVIIDSKDIATAQKSLYNLAWSEATKISK